MGSAKQSLRAGSQGQLPVVLCPKDWDGPILPAATPPGGQQLGPAWPPLGPGFPGPDTGRCPGFVTAVAGATAEAKAGQALKAHCKIKCTL